MQVYTVQWEATFPSSRKFYSFPKRKSNYYQQFAVYPSKQIYVGIHVCVCVCVNDISYV